MREDLEVHVRSPIQLCDINTDTNFCVFARTWQVLDGPVDHVWVEALNPVLDDNRTLCLSSGETLPLRDGIRMIMEVRVQSEHR